jgi:hypothetical protein
MLILKKNWSPSRQVLNVKKLRLPSLVIGLLSQVILIELERFVHKRRVIFRVKLKLISLPFWHGKLAF